MSGDPLTAIPSGGICDDKVVLAESRFVPQRYEPNYAYPLLVLFHGRGGDEETVVRSVPTMSWRNYVALGLRGPEVIRKGGEIRGYGWGHEFARPGSGRETAWRPRESDSVRLSRILRGMGDMRDLVEDGVFNAIRNLRRSLHIHSERIYLVGVGEGAAAAFSMALRYPERFAGIIALNGWLPDRSLRPLARLHACREQGLRLLMIHGEWNGRAPVEQARRDAALLKSAGLKVAFQSYPTANRLTSPMLADVDNWLIQQCTVGL
jgi:phospholipase/carboxylesterase